VKDYKHERSLKSPLR